MFHEGSDCLPLLDACKLSVAQFGPRRPRLTYLLGQLKMDQTRQTKRSDPVDSLSPSDVLASNEQPSRADMPGPIPR